jgi:hypothetical protein
MPKLRFADVKRGIGSSIMEFQLISLGKTISIFNGGNWRMTYTQITEMRIGDILLFWITGKACCGVSEWGGVKRGEREPVPRQPLI